MIGNSQAFTLTPINIGGEWAPGNSPGESHITGDVEFTGGELQMEIGGLTAGTEHDFVQITGTANLHSGKLAVALIDGHIPSIGSEYRIISAKRVDGHFEGLEAGYHAGGTGGLPVLPNEMRWHVAYDHGLVLSVSPKPPEVIIAATVNKTAEDTDTPGEFTITRAGNTDMGLTVYLSLNGTADESLDYQYIRKEVAFLPGQATAKVTVVGIPDFEEEHSETVIATLESHEDYVVGDENSATVIIENSDVPIDTGGGDGGNDADTGNDDGTDTDFWPDDPIQTGMPAASSASNSASTPERPSKPIASVESIDSTLEDFGTLFEPLIVVDVMNAPDA
ncbi:MAG: hypothetical protein CMJ78_03395 [Planctomycetaceae bacterium]|nr:hypothetical protein [Planctomycetaceae bacterium]